MKKTIIGFAIFIALILSAAVILPYMFRDKIIAAAKETANKELKAILNFENIDVSILQNIRHFPDITLIIDHPSITGIDQFHGDTLVKMDRLLLALDIQSLFQSSQPMDIHAITIENAHILAKIAADSSKNWEITTPSDQKKTSPFSLQIERITLDNVNIRYIDIPSNISSEIFGLHHTARGNFSDNLVQYISQTEIKDLSYYQGIVPMIKNVHLKNESEISIDQTSKKYSFEKNKITLNDLNLILNGSVQLLENNATNIQLDFNTENNDFKSILSLIPAIYKNNYSAIETKGKFDLKGTVKGIYHNASYPAMNIALNIQQGEFHYPDMPQRVSDIHIASHITSNGGTLDNMVVDIPKFAMRIGKDPFEGKMHITHPVSNPEIDLAAKGNINLADVEKFYPMDGVKKLEGIVNLDLNIHAKKSDVQSKNYQAIQASGSALMKGLVYESASVGKTVRISDLALHFSPQYVDMPSCTGFIGATDFQMNGKLENVIGYYLSTDEVMKGNLHFNSQKIDVNEFLSDKKDTKSDYVMVPRKIDFDGTANIKEMKYGKMTIQNIAGAMNIRDEKINLTNVQADLLGGHAKMNAIYSTVGQTKPITAVNYDISSFDINAVYNYMECAPTIAPIMKYMNGKLSSKSQLSMSLTPDMSPDLQTINGDFSLAIPIAKVVNLPILNQVAQVTKLNMLQNIEASNIQANLSFDNGRIILQPTAFKTNDMDMMISGLQGLDKSIDYKMAIDVPFSKLGNASSVVNSLISKYHIPFIGNVQPEKVRIHTNIKGFFDKPVVTLGAPEILSNGKTADAKTMAVDAVKKVGDDIKNQAIKTADSLKNQAIKEAETKINEVKKRAEEEANKKKDELLNELKKKLPW